MIIHAGDIGSVEILEKLKEIAPVIAVRGNIDTKPWTEKLSLWQIIELEHINIYVMHDIGKIKINPQEADIQLIIMGHSHKPGKEKKDGVLYVNPGSAGPRRFKLPISVALIEIDERELYVRFIDL